jgi:prepilin-type N-terminal cleavage/methylation domain-containing protein
MTVIRTLRNQERGGFTLIELLVVVAIILSVAALTLATIPPSKFEREVREASRTITALAQSARDMAARTGRDHGILIERQSDFDTDNLAGAGGRPIYTPGVGLTVSIIADQPAYSGDFSDSKALVFSDESDPSSPRIFLGHLGSVQVNNMTGVLEAGGPDLAWMNRVRPGDLITLHGVPFQFRIVSSGVSSNGTINQAPSASQSWELEPVVGITANSRFMRPGVTLAYQYSIQLGPQKIPGRSVDLPDTVAIDMNGSGVGLTGFQFRGNLMNSNEATSVRADRVGAQSNQENQNPVAIMFSPQGEVSRVIVADPQPNGGGQGVAYNTAGLILASTNINLPIAPIYLLLGKREQVAIDYLSATEGVTNWNDAESQWVVILPKTGRVKTSQNVVARDLDSIQKGTALELARSLASQAEGLGGE